MHFPFFLFLLFLALLRETEREKERKKWRRVASCAGKRRGCTVSQTRRAYAGTAMRKFTVPTFLWRGTRGPCFAKSVGLWLHGNPLALSSVLQFLCVKPALTTTTATNASVARSLRVKKVSTIMMRMRNMRWRRRKRRERIRWFRGPVLYRRHSHRRRRVPRVARRRRKRSCRVRLFRHWSERVWMQISILMYVFFLFSFL